MENKLTKSNILINLLACLFIFSSIFSFISMPVSAQSTNGLSGEEQSQLDEMLAPIHKFTIATQVIAGAIAGLVLAIAGIMLSIGRGNPANVERAKQMIGYTVVGLVVIIIAPSAIKFIIS